MRARSLRLLGAIFICSAGLASLAPAAITLPSVVGVDSVGTTDYPNGGIVETGMFTGFLREDDATCAIVSPDGERAWIGLGRRPGGIVEVDIANEQGRLERVRAADLPQGTSPIRAAAIDPLGQFGYFLAASQLSPMGETNHLFKVDLATLAPVAQLDFAAGEDASCLAADSAGVYAYVGLFAAPGRIIRVNLATMEREGELTLPAADSILAHAAIDPADDFAYFIALSAGIRIVKVRLSDFTRENSETIDAAVLDVNGFALDPSGAFAYVTTAEATGRFLRINLNTLAGVQAATMPAGLGQLGGICVNAAGTAALGYADRLLPFTVDLATLNATAASFTSSYGFAEPSDIVRVPRSPETTLSFSRGTSPVFLQAINFEFASVSNLVLEGGERDFKAMTLDPDGRHCLLSGGVTFPVVAAVGATNLERLDGDGSPFFVGQTTTGVAAITRISWLAGIADNANGLTEFPGGGFVQASLNGTGSSGGTIFNDMPEGPLSLAYRRYDDRLYYCFRDGGPAILRSNNLGFTSSMNLLTLGDGEAVPHIALNPDAADFYFSRSPAGLIGHYHDGTIEYSEGLFGALAGVMRNRATGEILAVQAGTPGSAFGLDPASLEIQRNLNLTVSPGVEAQGILAAAMDPILGRFAVYSANPGQIIRHDMQDFAKAAALEVGQAPEAMALDPDGARLFAYYQQANALGRYALTPRERIEGTRFHLSETAESESVSFYSHAAVPARRIHVELPPDLGQYPVSVGLFDRTRGRIWYAPTLRLGPIYEYDPISREFGRTAFPFGLEEIVSGAIDTLGVHGCFGDDESPAHVARFNLAAGTVGPLRTLNAGENFAGAAAIDPAGDFAYFAVRTTPAKIIKFQLSDFTRVGELSLGSGENIISDLVIDAAGQFMYAPFSTGGFFSSCGVVKIQLSSFSRVGALPGSGSGANKAAIDPQGTYLYVAAASPIVIGGGSPGLINRYQLSDFTSAGSLTLQDDERAAFALAIDPDGEFLLASVAGNPAGIVRVDLSTFTREAVYRLRQDTEINIRAMHLDDEGEFAFLGLNTTPGRVVTFEVNPRPLRLAVYEDFGAFFVRRWQSQALAVPTGGSWMSVPIGEGEPSQLALDRGDYLLAWQFDADEFGPSHQPGNPGNGIRVLLPYGEFPDSITQGAFGRAPDAASPETSGWTETSSLWSAYLTYEVQNSAGNWETLE